MVSLDMPVDDRYIKYLDILKIPTNAFITIYVARLR